MTVEEIAQRTQPGTEIIAGVRFFDVGKLYHFGCSHLAELRIGDYVVVETTRGRQLGQVMNMISADEAGTTRDYKPIMRMATPSDMMSQKMWQAREVEALITCREKAAGLGGFDNAKFVAAQYNFDGTLLTFLFSAEDKLNTSKLRGQLQRSFKAKIEMRQIGPRDVAKLLGGMGACGIPRCCSTFLTDFSPISIKMAKAQGISLNPSEITGMCGRLRCCLIYEYEQYVEARKHLPKRNKRVGTPYGEGRVIDVLPLRDAAVVVVEDTRYTVEREEIIPLEEWLALKAKAEAGCEKGESGPCECGARQGPAASEEEAEAPVQGAAQAESEREEAPPADQEDQEQRSRGRGRRRGRSRRGRGRRSSRKKDSSNRNE